MIGDRKPVRLIANMTQQQQGLAPCREQGRVRISRLKDLLVFLGEADRLDPVDLKLSQDGDGDVQLPLSPVNQKEIGKLRELPV